MGDLTRANLASCIVDEFREDLEKEFYVEHSSIIKQCLEYDWNLEEIVYAIYWSGEKELRTILPFLIFNTRKDPDTHLVEMLCMYLHICDNEEMIYKRIEQSKFYDFYTEK